MRRLVPEGVNLTGTDYPVEDALPAIFSKRNNNRGFESLTMSRDERTIYGALQGPLSNPDDDVADKSRTTRMLALSTETGPRRQNMPMNLTIHGPSSVAPTRRICKSQRWPGSTQPRCWYWSVRMKCPSSTPPAFRMPPICLGARGITRVQRRAWNH